MSLRHLLTRISIPFCEDENERPAIDALPMVSAASFAGQKPPAMSDAVFGLIPSRIVVTLNGDGAVGKSLLALQLCIASVSGTPWLGLQVQQGPCLFITAEDEIGECHRRINAICTADGIDIERLGNLNIVSLVGKDALLAVPDTTKSFADDGYVRTVGENDRNRPSRHRRA